MRPAQISAWSRAESAAGERSGVGAGLGPSAFRDAAGRLKRSRFCTFAPVSAGGFTNSAYRLGQPSTEAGHGGDRSKLET